MSAPTKEQPARLHDLKRLQTVRATGLLDTPVEDSFDRLTKLAAKLTGAPVTFISLVDEDRDFYKSCFGFPEPLASDRQLEGTTFCHYAIQSDRPLIIDNTREHPTYRDVPTVKSLGVSAYLGIPLVTADGQAIGSFCAIDFQPRQWRALDVEVMTELAASTMREIELRMAQRNIVAERRLLEVTIRQMPEGVIIATPDGKITLSNARAREIVGRDIKDFNEEGAAAQRWPLVRAIRAGETIEDEPYTMQRADGSTRYFTVNATPVLDGEVIAGVVTIHDVTAARMAQEEREHLLQRLDQERSRLRTLLDHVPAGVLFAEAPSGRITMGNPRVLEILGHSVLGSENEKGYDTEWIGFHPDGRRVEPHEWPLARALHGETVHGENFLYQCGDGRKTWIRVQGAPVLDAGGSIIGSIVAFYDIDEMRRMTLANERLYEEAQRANQAKDDFFAAITHELRTPMTAIIGWSRLLKMDLNNSPDALEAAEMIESSARLQARLVDDLLDVSRIAEGKIVLSREPIDVNQVIDEAVRAADPSAGGQGIRLRSRLSTVPLVLADSSRLRQILGNLLSNAMKFTPSGGLVEVTSTAENGTVKISVRDSGRGISAELLPHIFERGRQARHAEQGGLGLGLTIVKHLVELHDGTIHAESEGAGKGATFTLTLRARGSSSPE